MAGAEPVFAGVADASRGVVEDWPARVWIARSTRTPIAATPAGRINRRLMSSLLAVRDTFDSAGDVLVWGRIVREVTSGR
jgi:hypothetical protein